MPGEAVFDGAFGFKGDETDFVRVGADKVGHDGNAQPRFDHGNGVEGGAAEMEGDMAALVEQLDLDHIHTPGTYTASAKGYHSDVTVTVTFDETHITDVVVDSSGETENVGAAAADKLAEQVLSAQSSAIDGVGGATKTSKAVKAAVADCISQASGGAIVEGGDVSVQEDITVGGSTDWLGEAPEIDESEITQTLQTGILVVGADKDPDPTTMLFDRGVIAPDQLSDGNWEKSGYFHLGSQPWLKVNLNGERFCNESVPYDFILHAAYMEPNHLYNTIYDSSWVEQIEQFQQIGCARIIPSQSGGKLQIFSLEAEQGLLAQMEQAGFVQSSDTLEGLAEKLNLPADTFVATVQRYNELCAKGEDEDFGKESSRMLPLENPPYLWLPPGGKPAVHPGRPADQHQHAGAGQGGRPH